MRNINPCQVPQIKKNLHIHEMTLDYVLTNVQSVDRTMRYCVSECGVRANEMERTSQQHQPRMERKVSYQSLSWVKVFSSMRWQTVTVTNPLNVMNHILCWGHCSTHTHTFVSNIHCVVIFDVTSRTNCNHSRLTHMLRLGLARKSKRYNAIFSHTPNRTEKINTTIKSPFPSFPAWDDRNSVHHKNNVQTNECRERERKKRRAAPNITRKITRIKVSYGCFVVWRLDLSKNISFIKMSFSLDSDAGRHNPYHLLEN